MYQQVTNQSCADESCSKRLMSSDSVYQAHAAAFSQERRLEGARLVQPHDAFVAPISEVHVAGVDGQTERMNDRRVAQRHQIGAVETSMLDAIELRVRPPEALCRVVDGQTVRPAKLRLSVVHSSQNKQYNLYKRV